MSKPASFICQLTVAAALCAWCYTAPLTFAGNPERPPAEATVQTDLENDPAEKKQIGTPMPDARTANASISAAMLVKQIYARTKTAKTAKDFSALVVQCERALESPNAPTEQLTQDIHGLLAWALCKRGQERVDLAISLRSAGNRDQFNAVLGAALADFDRSLELDESRWKTWFSRSVAVANLDRTEEALRNLDKAIALNPKSQKAHFNRAELLNWNGNASAAIQDYKVVLESSPKDVQAINGLAHAHLALKQFERAIELYTRVTQLQPENSIAWQARGEAFQTAGNWKAANDDFSKSISMQKSARGYLKAAWLLSTCPDPDFFEPITALEYARQGRQFDPKSVECLEVLAAASAANGEFTAAVDLQKQAIEKSATVQSDYQFDTDQMKVRLTAYQQEELYLQR